MKKVIVVLLIVLLVLTSFLVLGLAGLFGQGSADLLASMIVKSRCVAISSGNLMAPDGSSIKSGPNAAGYNYGAGHFSGKLCDAYGNADWCQPYADVKLTMRWNDAWLSSRDCDGDKILDRHYGYDTYLGSGAFATYHLSGTYTGPNEENCNWDYSAEIVATDRGCMPDGLCYEKDNTLIGKQIWTDFALAEDTLKDPCGGYTGIRFGSDSPMEMFLP